MSIGLRVWASAPVKFSLDTLLRALWLALRTSRKFPVKHAWKAREGGLTALLPENHGPPRIRASPRLARASEIGAHLEAATARLFDLIREFDTRGGWNNGFASCAHWLAWRVGMDLGAARERVRVARAVGSLPRLADALARGELSYAKVRALTRVATPETEERLLAVGKAGTACHVERIVRGWRRVDALTEARETTQHHKGRGLQVYQDDDGMVVIRGRLTPESGAVLMQALAAARETLYQRGADEREDVSAEGIIYLTK